MMRSTRPAASAPKKTSSRWLLIGAAALAGLGIAATALTPPHSLAADRGHTAVAQAQSTNRTQPAAAPRADRTETASVANTSAAQPALDREQVASVEDLKSQAFRALKEGHFDQTNALLARAAAISHDPTITQMAAWTNQFESQRQTFVAERKKQYDKAVEDVHKLLAAGKDDYAIDAAARAYLLSADHKLFRQEKWVDDLIKQTSAKADEYENSEQWLKALRLYSDLGSVEPANPEWKEKLKLATRRIRLLALYTPDELKKLQESETKVREEVDAILHPTTQPATKPAADKADLEKPDNFRVDWHETLRGIKGDMLTEALTDAQKNYFRDTNFKTLVTGGLNGLRTLVTTHGLEKAFPKLADEGKRAQFLEALDASLQAAQAATPDNERMLTFNVILKIKTVNRNTIELPEEVWVSEFADGAFAELDPFTSMIWPNDLEEFNKTTQGEFSGVGIQIQSDDDGSLRVVSPLEDSPAYKAGIKAGDVITHINGKNAKGITLNQAVKTITGLAGTNVTLTVRSSDAKVREYTIKRETIKVASIKGWSHKPGGGWDWLVDPAQKIAYIRLTNFTKTTSEDLDRAADEIKKAGGKALILDLRYNPGGLLTAATEVCDKFLHDGVIVSTRADRVPPPNAPTVATAKADDDEVDLPTIVLVNQYSASASEIVSGALKDQHRAMVVGERTFGKGSVQMLFPLSNRQSFLKLTTSHYYLPSGRCIHREENSQEWGVDPDVTVEMTPEQMRAAIDARQELDVLREAGATPAQGKQEKLNAAAPKVEEKVQNATGDNAKGGKSGPTATKPAARDPLSTDPQLSAAVLLLRLQLAGAQL